MGLHFGRNGSVAVAESNFQITNPLPFSQKQYHQDSSEKSVSASCWHPFLSGLPELPRVPVLTEDAPFLGVWVLILRATLLSF